MTKLREMAEKIVHGREPQSDLVTEVETALREVAEVCMKIVLNTSVESTYAELTPEIDNLFIEREAELANAIKTRFALEEPKERE